MVRLFLKFYGVLIATLVLSFVVQMQVIDYVWSHVDGFDYRVRFKPGFALLEHALAPYPESEWPARFDSLAGGLGVPSHLVRADGGAELARLTPPQRKRYDAGEIVSLDRAGGGFTLVKRLAGSGQAAAFDMPGPDTSRTKLLTYAANWSVEFTLVAILVWFWVRPFWRELIGLRQAAERLGEGDFAAHAEAGRGSALRGVADAFNRMAAQVAQLLKSHRTLTSAVSHELRTPIARLRFAHSLARDEPTAAGKDKHLARMEHDIDEIDQLTSELLDYARLERGSPPLALHEVPAAPWLEDVLAEAGPDAKAAAIESRVEVERVRCEPRYMARAVANLVRNARRHARNRVAVSIEQVGADVAIHVDDDGLGVAPADRERLFEPFVRADGSRDRDSGGFGLGLAIVRQVARWHGGDARLAESPLGGARASIRWPSRPACVSQSLP